MRKHIFPFLRRGVQIIKKTLLDSSSLINILPSRDYWRHVPQNVERFMKDNWRKTGDFLYRAMKKVGEKI